MFGALFVAADKSVEVFAVLRVLRVGDREASVRVKSARSPQAVLS